MSAKYTSNSEIYLHILWGGVGNRHRFLQLSDVLTVSRKNYE